MHATFHGLQTEERVHDDREERDDDAHDDAGALAGAPPERDEWDDGEDGYEGNGDGNGDGDYGDRSRREPAREGEKARHARDATEET